MGQTHLTPRMYKETGDRSQAGGKSQLLCKVVQCGFRMGVKCAACLSTSYLALESFNSGQLLGCKRYFKTKQKPLFPLIVGVYFDVKFT